jgi:hypothetical protein
MKNLLILIILFTSCNTAEKLTYKAISKDRAKVAEITRKEWPCVVTAADTTYRIDTLYDLIEVQCPDTLIRVDSFETAVRVPVYIKVPLAREVRTVTVVKLVEDSAKIFLLTANVAALQANVAKITAERDNYKVWRNKWRKWCLITWAILIVVGVLFTAKKIYL